MTLLPHDVTLMPRLGRRSCFAIATAAFLGAFAPAWARGQEHAGHGQAHGAAAETDSDASSAEEPSVEGGRDASALSLDELREGSGTSWQPSSVPHAAAHFPLGRAQLMLHGTAAVGYLTQGTARGDDQFIGPAWGMAMLRLPLATASLTLRAMLSPDPFTVGARGYPLLLQSGEGYHGEPLHDRQHPHDLFMELAASLRVPVSDALAVSVYAAPVGEPALGPTAAPHRASAAADPLAPISHHWQDSTHVSFGVLTAGLATRFAKIEGSIFNGREPNDRRTDLEKPHLDSWSVRLSVAPQPALSLQASYGFVKSPEQLRPDEDLHRATASVTWAPGGKMTAASLIWGVNREPGHDDHSVLLEGDWDLDGRNTVFGRLEWVQKAGAELSVPGVDSEERFGVAGISLGYLRAFSPYGAIAPALGVRGNLGVVPSSLSRAYGGDASVGLFVYMLLRPATGGAHSVH